MADSVIKEDREEKSPNQFKRGRKSGMRGRKSASSDKTNAKSKRSSENCNFRSDDIPHKPGSDGSSADKLSSLNDFSWYNKYPNLANLASKISYPYKPGMKVPLVGTTISYTIPGFMALDWVPSIGNSAVSTDPASLVAKEVYARVRNAYSGTLRVDPPEYPIYFVCLDSIFSYIGTLKRIFRQLNAYTPENYLIPETLLQAEGVTAADIPHLQARKKDLCNYINLLINMTRKFRCPAVFDLFNRHYWMNDNVYGDAAVPNSQMYVFVQNGYYMYTALNTPDNVLAAGATMTQPGWFRTSMGSTVVDVMYSYGLGLIQALDGWDDSYTISGYLARAFEGSPSFAVDELGYEEKFSPVYQEEVLSQIENASWLPGPVTDWLSSMNITQNPKTNSLLCNPSFRVMNPTTAGGRYHYLYSGIELNAAISLPYGMDSPEANIIATRLLTLPIGVEAGETTDNVPFFQFGVEAGTEIVIGNRIYGASESGGIIEMYLPKYHTVSMSATADQSQERQAIITATNFDWLPLIWEMITSGPGILHSVRLTGDVKQVTSINHLDLREIHRVCMFSEFNSFSITE